MRRSPRPVPAPPRPPPVPPRRRAVPTGPSKARARGGRALRAPGRDRASTAGRPGAPGPSRGFRPRRPRRIRVSADRAACLGPERPPIASRSRVAAAGSSAAVMAATARAARAACSGSTDVSMLSSCPSSLARAWCASALARVGRPARSASSAASAAHQGEPGGTGLVARAASRRARLDNVPAEPGVGRERVRSARPGCCAGYHARRFRAEQPDKHRCYLLTDRDGPVGPGDIDYHPAKTAIGTVEGQVQTRHRNQRGLSCHSPGEALEDHLAGLALKTRREVS